MNIKVNNKMVTVPEGSSLFQLAQTLELPEKVWQSQLIIKWFPVRIGLTRNWRRMTKLL